MVGRDDDLRIRAASLDSPFLEGLNDSEHVFVVDFVITLCGTHCLTVECHGMPSILVLLGQHASDDPI